MELPIEYIIRPLQKTRSYDPEKVQGLADSIAEIGLQEPVSRWPVPFGLLHTYCLH
jgi:ParB-like chromosome segregation protein Spo0J